VQSGPKSAQLCYLGSMFIISPKSEEWQEATHLMTQSIDALTVEPGDIFFHEGAFCEVTAFVTKNRELIGIRYIKHGFFET